MVWGYKTRVTNKSNDSGQERRRVERHPEGRSQSENTGRDTETEKKTRGWCWWPTWWPGRNIQGELGEQNSAVFPRFPLQSLRYTLHFPDTVWSKSVRKSWVYFNVSLEKSEAPPATNGLPQTWKGSKELIQPFTSNPLTVSPARWLASVWTWSDREITLAGAAVLTLGSVSSYWEYVCLKRPSSDHGLH